jgi:hypothetical protein
MIETTWGEPTRSDSVGDQTIIETMIETMIETT